MIAAAGAVLLEAALATTSAAINVTHIDFRRRAQVLRVADSST